MTRPTRLRAHAPDAPYAPNTSLRASRAQNKIDAPTRPKYLTRPMRPNILTRLTRPKLLTRLTRPQLLTQRKMVDVFLK